MIGQRYHSTPHHAVKLDFDEFFPIKQGRLLHRYRFGPMRKADARARDSVTIDTLFAYQ